jgi:hypothetical protein
MRSVVSRRQATYERAIRNVPGSGMIWEGYIRSLELAAAPIHQIEVVYNKSLAAPIASGE